MAEPDTPSARPGKVVIAQEDRLSLSMTTLLSHLRDIRKIELVHSQEMMVPSPPNKGLMNHLLSLSDALLAAGHHREADTLTEVYSLGLLSSDFGGLGYTPDGVLTAAEEVEILFLVSAWLESLNSADRSKTPPQYLASPPPGRRAMTLSEKIFAAHDIEQRGEVKPGDVVRIDVDWIMASELSWSGMERAYGSLGSPGIFRNDRFWLAGDHVVDPRIKDNPQVMSLVASSDRARNDFRMTDYQGTNYTIMHTEFCRERAQPGMLVIGSDSHTCSAGSVGALAIGLGVADVTMSLITGETWFKIPDTVNIRFVNEPSPGVGGKDIILYILKELKRNTVAADRVVEFTGPGLQHLSCDARFAIANMTTEFGGITGIFVPDEVTQGFVGRRKSPRHKRNSTYFRPDDDAVYAATHVIDLAQVESFIARYPCPDDVVPVSEMEGTALDGCFIGACTTAEEDLILGALVLEGGLRKGLSPTGRGKRKVVPGSLPILNRMRALGFVDIYKKAGFEIGVPGCSYCVGMGADRAGEGEVWISSQNRNFENRMGKGAIGHLGSAATVAASSFAMTVTDPRAFLEELNRDHLNEVLRRTPLIGNKNKLNYVEPGQELVRESPTSGFSVADDSKSKGAVASNGTHASQSTLEGRVSSQGAVIRGKVQRLGDFIDTDALAPAEILTTCKTNEEFGAHCLKHTHPDFRAKARDGHSVVVAGKAFGCGSSRDVAVSALMGTGIECVIAKSFAFIYGRNQPNLGLLGIVIEDESFYDAAGGGKEVSVDLAGRRVTVGGETGEWYFQLSRMEKELIAVGGVSQAFSRFGKRLFEVMCATKEPVGNGGKLEFASGCDSASELQW